MSKSSSLSLLRAKGDCELFVLEMLEVSVRLQSQRGVISTILPAHPLEEDEKVM